MSDVISTTKGGEPENTLLKKIDSPSRPIPLHDSYKDKVMAIPGTNVELSPVFLSKSSYVPPRKPVGEESPNVNQNTETGNSKSTSPQAEPPKNVNSNSAEPASYKIQAPPKELTAKNNLSGDYGQVSDPNAAHDFTRFLKNPEDAARDRHSHNDSKPSSTQPDTKETGLENQNSGEKPFNYTIQAPPKHLIDNSSDDGSGKI
jgi:hypothetical protein